MNLTKNDILAGAVLSAFAATIIYAFDTTRKLKTISDRLNTTVKDLVDGIDINISEKLVNDAVEREVKKEVKYCVEKAANKAAGDIVSGYKSDIRDVVEDEFKKQKNDVAKALKAKIDDIDIRELKREVVREAKDATAAKLKKDLEDISDKYTEQIESMTNIYSTIASKIEAIGD